MRMLSPSDLHWIAGLLEGEGYFGTHGRRNINLTLSMTDRDVMERARTILSADATLYVERLRPPSNKQAWRLHVSGYRAVGWMMTLYTLMGLRRREAIKKVIRKWRGIAVGNILKWQCKRGHPFNAENTYQYRPKHRMCRQCARERGRIYAADKRSAFIGPRRAAGRPEV